MKCPLFAIASKEQERRGFLTHINCLKKECAWWEQEANCCAMLLIPRHLYTLERMLALLLERMPQEVKP